MHLAIFDARLCVRVLCSAICVEVPIRTTCSTQPRALEAFHNGGSTSTDFAHFSRRTPMVGHADRHPPCQVQDLVRSTRLHLHRREDTGWVWSRAALYRSGASSNQRRRGTGSTIWPDWRNYTYCPTSCNVCATAASSASATTLSLPNRTQPHLTVPATTQSPTLPFAPSGKHVAYIFLLVTSVSSKPLGRWSFLPKDSSHLGLNLTSSVFLLQRLYAQQLYGEGSPSFRARSCGPWIHVTPDPLSSPSGTSNSPPPSGGSSLHQSGRGKTDCTTCRIRGGDIPAGWTLLKTPLVLPGHLLL